MIACKKMATIILVMGWSSVAWPALPSAILVENPGQASLSSHIEYLEDKEGTLTIHEVATSSEFTDAGEDTPNFGFTDSVYWFRFSITNNTKQSTLLLEQGYIHIDYISLFSRGKEGELQEQQSGDMLPFKNRARPYRTITFEITVEPGETKDFFVRTQTSSSTQLPLKVYTEATFSQVSERETAALSAYYGIILVMIVFNLFLWMSLRDKTYLSYVGYLVFYLIAQLILNGNALRYLFPESPYLNSVALPFSMIMGILFAYRFTREFMTLGNLLPKTSRIIIYIEYILLAVGIISIWTPYALIIKPATLVTILGPITFLILGIACVRKGYPPAKTYLIAWSTFLIGLIIFAFRALGILPSNAFTEFAIQVGSALEVTLLSLALADRIHVVKNQEARTQAALLQETNNHSQTTNQLNQALHSKLFLFSDLAHRVNNPLNIAQGGNESSQTGLREFSQAVFSLLPEPSERNAEEEAVVQHLKDSVQKLNNSLEDTHAGLHRAANYVNDLRILSGVDGESPEPICLEKVLRKSIDRLHEDLGEAATRRVLLPGNLPNFKVVGHSSTLAVGLTSWIAHTLLRKPDDHPVQLSVSTEASGDYVWLKATSLNQAIFSSNYHEDIPAKDVVLGLLGRQGVTWQENTNDQGEPIEFLLRLAANEDAWFEAQGGKNRK
jgi:signal transduction histidine kinase